MHVYLDEEFEASSLEEFLGKVHVVAEEAWHRAMSWEKELAARPRRIGDGASELMTEGAASA